MWRALRFRYGFVYTYLSLDLVLVGKIQIVAAIFGIFRRIRVECAEEDAFRQLENIISFYFVTWHSDQCIFVIYILVLNKHICSHFFSYWYLNLSFSSTLIKYPVSYGPYFILIMKTFSNIAD